MINKNKILKAKNPVYSENVSCLLPASEPIFKAIPDDVVKTFDLPTHKNFIPVYEPYIGDVSRVVEQVNSGWISFLSKSVLAFEKKFADFLGMKHAISCTSGTAALHLAIASLGLKSSTGFRNLVLHPDFTMIAVPNAVSYMGGESILVDSYSGSYNMDLDLLEELYEKNKEFVSGVIVTHTYGLPCDLYRIKDFCDRNGLWLVEDSAESLGIKFSANSYCGTIGDVNIFSLYANKTITTGEGGMVVTNDDDVAKIIRILMNHGFDKEKHFYHKYLGYNYRFTGLQAALGLSQLDIVNEIIDNKRKITDFYNLTLSSIPNIKLPEMGYENTCWMYGVEVNEKIDKDKVRFLLAENGIETRNFFIPISLQPYYYGYYRGKAYPTETKLNDNAIKFMNKGFYLPSSPSLTYEEIVYVSVKLQEAIEKAKY
ncbi:MAG: hypothetical protein GF317_04765 [Candidatus Lokiarchaeota archaeon]|nr:hypothetical protein [Candidatus Lokiarchaeota archaeon]